MQLNKTSHLPQKDEVLPPKPLWLRHWTILLATTVLNGAENCSLLAYF